MNDLSNSSKFLHIQFAGLGGVAEFQESGIENPYQDKVKPGRLVYELLDLSRGRSGQCVDLDS